MSSCCDSSICSHFLKCYKKCNANADCSATTSCCSDGYCTHEVLCQSNKVNGDSCDVSSECISNYCVDGACTDDYSSIKKWMVIAGFSIIIALIMFGIGFYYCLKNFNQQNDTANQNALTGGGTSARSSSLIDNDMSQLALIRTTADSQSA